MADAWGSYLARGVEPAQPKRQLSFSADVVSPKRSKPNPPALARNMSRTMSAKLLAADLVERIFTTLAFKGDRITAAQMAVMLEHVVICRDAVDDGGSDSGGAVSRKRATAGWRAVATQPPDQWLRHRRRGSVHALLRLPAALCAVLGVGELPRWGDSVH